MSHDFSTDSGTRAIPRRRGLLHRAVMVGAIVAGLAAVGVVVADRHASAVVDRAAPLPVPPAGTKWVGVGHDVVAVPRGWPVVPGVYCQGPAEPYVTITQWHVVVSCPPMIGRSGHPYRPAPSIDIEGNSSGGFLAQVEDVAGSGGVSQQSVDASRTTLPTGWLAVPSGEKYSGGAGSPSLSNEIAALEAAGFDVVRESAGPDPLGQMVTTDPAIGTPARRGSTVVVYDHSVPAASVMLSGTLDWVGGPAPGSPVPHPGTIHVVSADDAIDQTVRTDAHGRWRVLVPPGAYTVSGTSPGYRSAAGSYDACSTTGTVLAQAGQTTAVTVTCQLR